MTKDSQGIISIKNKAIDKNILKNPDYVRLNHYEGDWTFQKLGSNKVKVSTSGYANPEGSIPLEVCEYVCPTTTLSNAAKNEKSIAGTRRHSCPFTELPYVNFKDEEACNAGFFMF